MKKICVINFERDKLHFYSKETYQEKDYSMVVTAEGEKR